MRPTPADYLGEVPFGGQAPKRAEAAVPWDHGLPVEIPGTEFRHLRLHRPAGPIRVPLGGARARLQDREAAQAHRCARRRTRVAAVPVRLRRAGPPGIGRLRRSSLHYPKEGICLPLDQPDTALGDLARHLAAAGDSLRAGNAHPGPDAEEAYNDLSFALPANAGELYCPRKRNAVRAALGEAAGSGRPPDDRAARRTLADAAQRALAIAAHERSMIVEAGAAPQDSPDVGPDRSDARLRRRARGKSRPSVSHRTRRERAP